MKTSFIMDSDYLSGYPEDSALLIQWMVKTSPHRILYVVDHEQRFMGVVRLEDSQAKLAATLEQLMVPQNEVATVSPDDEVEVLLPLFRNHPDWSSIPVISEGKLLGVVSREWEPTPEPVIDESWRNIPLAQLQQYVLDALYTGLIIVDDRGTTRMLNPAGAEILSVDSGKVVGKPYEELAQYLFPHMREYLKVSAVPKVLAGAADRGERQLLLPNGRHVLFKFATIREQGKVRAVLVTFMDITPQKQAEVSAYQQERELEMAFSLTLPNSKVEAKLKSSPEYQDIYDPGTGQARVTDVIPDGTYHHVINGLRIMAELKNIGVFQLVGVDKDTLVQAFIFHDIGKAQPTLKAGEMFVPRDTFEPGYLHAARSADWAHKDYHVTTDVEWLIRYHHTRETELPPDFPSALKPMMRLFQLVDGLSAAMTRRNAYIAPMSLNGSVLTIDESNVDLRYNRRYRLAIYTGEVLPLPKE